MTVNRFPVYGVTAVNVPGVVAANTYLTVFNPVGSGVVITPIRAEVQCLTIAAALDPSYMQASLITSSTGGTLVAATDVNKFDEVHYPDPEGEVRIGNPTVTIRHPYALATWPPVVSTGEGNTGAAVMALTGAGQFFYEGEGFAYHADGGDVDQSWSFHFVWGEIH